MYHHRSSIGCMSRVKLSLLLLLLFHYYICISITTLHHNNNNKEYIQHVHGWINLPVKSFKSSGLITSTTSTILSLATASPLTTIDDTCTTASTTYNNDKDTIIFNEFVDFLIQQQQIIINEIETTIEASSQQTFTNDTWGIFSYNIYNTTAKEPQQSSSSSSGGITRVIQNGTAIEKGACSLTVIRNGILSKERAIAILGRQQQQQQQQQATTTNNNDNINKQTIPSIQEGDTYSAVALSMVLHSRNPMVPTFRSDIRMFQVISKSSNNTNTNNNARTTTTWIGGGADLTPYYLYHNDIQNFHSMYYNLCNQYNDTLFPYTYRTMKQACDTYFYLPARNEHRGTGGIFFDDLFIHHHNTNNNNTSSSVSILDFGKDMTQMWMKSYIPIVLKRNNISYTYHEKQWQKIRRGRYLEFNLLYDRGVKFGLQTNNPRVEGVMVSAPPEIAFVYNYIPIDAREQELIDILHHPIEWI